VPQAERAAFDVQRLGVRAIGVDAAGNVHRGDLTRTSTPRYRRRTAVRTADRLVVRSG
jgi:hypothetical protein